MKHWFLCMMVCVLAAGCYQRQDPVVQAAQDLERMAYEIAAQGEERRQQLTALRLGMSDSEVLEAVGPPSVRRSVATGAEESREVWNYKRGLGPAATLTFVNQRLVEIVME
jgi:hypothetical protein